MTNRVEPRGVFTRPYASANFQHVHTAHLPFDSEPVISKPTLSVHSTWPPSLDLEFRILNFDETSALS